MTRHEEPGEPCPQENIESENRLVRRVKKAGVIGASVLALAGVGLEAGKLLWWDRSDRSGDVIEMQPRHHVLNKTAQPLGNELGIVTWNMKREASLHISDIRKIANRQKVSAFLLQEVTSNDITKLRTLTDEGWYLNAAVGDSRHNRVSDWEGIAILTRQPQENSSAISLRGTTYYQTVSGKIREIIEGTAYAALQKSSDSIVEGSEKDRVAEVSTIEVLAGDDPEKIKIVNAHVTPKREVSYIYGSDRVHDNQLKELARLLKEETEGGFPVILAADLNAPEKEAIPWLGELGFTTIATDPTFIDGVLRPDYIAYKPGKLGFSFSLQESEVMKYQTDHHPVRAKFVFPRPEQIELRYKRSITSKQEKLNELQLHNRNNGNN